MKKNKVILVCIIGFVTFVTPCFGQSQKKERAEVVFLSPQEDLMWVGDRQITMTVKNIEPGDVRLVELFLDGRLLKEFRAPPYTLTHHFGTRGQNRVLRAAARGEGNKLLARGILRSFQVDDEQTVEVKRVVVPVVVKDRKGNYVRGLKKEDFLLSVDGKPGEISFFSTRGTAQFNMVQVIDISTSMRFKIHDVLDAAKDFMETLMTPGDKGNFVFFNHIVFDFPGFTGDMKELNERLELQSPAAGETALYDAVAQTLNLMSKTRGWNIIVIFSDGKDNSSYIDPYSLIEKVRKSSVVVYAIDNYVNRSENVLAEICKISGGMTFPLDSVKKTRRVYEKIRADIHAQYILYFDASSFGGRFRFHPLTVTVKNKDYDIRTIKGYSDH